jgi:hypothetical protein
VIIKVLNQNFPEKNLVFSAGQKIGTIFCPKGGLAAVNHEK